VKVPITPKQIARAEKFGNPASKDCTKTMALKPKQIARLQKFGMSVPVDCAKKRTLWVEAKVVPKKVEVGDGAEEHMAPSEEYIDASSESVENNDRKGDEWDVVATK